MPDNVTPLVPRRRRVNPPAVLQELPCWLIWRLMQARVEGAKMRKVPYYAEGGLREGGNGTPEDRAALVGYQTAVAALTRRNFTGIGFALLAGCGIVALDFDNCIVPGMPIPAEIQSICAQTYAEISPSGTGIRAFVRANLGNFKTATVLDDKGNVLQYGFEVFSDKGYVTFTGNVVEICELMGFADTVSDDPKLIAEIQTLCDQRFGKNRRQTTDPDDPFLGKKPRAGWSEERIRELVNSRWLDPNMSRADWIKVGGAIYHESFGEDWGFDVWYEWSQEASIAGKASTREQMESDWRSFANRDGSASTQSTIGSVVWMAKRNGYNPAKEAIVDADHARQVYERAKPEVPPKAVASKGKWDIVGFDDAHELIEDEWFIEGVLPRSAHVGVIYGPPGSGKSFFALDLGLTIARGQQWRGRDVERDRVLYIAAEGEGGVPKRLKAYQLHNKLMPGETAMGVLYGAPDLSQSEDIDALIESVAAAGGVGMIIIDTLAQTTPGANENSGEDMSVVIANCKALSVATGALVLLVHHLGKDANRGMRGWSGLHGAVDFAIEVVRIEDSGLRFARIAKMKDDVDDAKLGFRLLSITIGKNSKGRDITSCVVVDAEAPTGVSKDKPNRDVSSYTSWERHIREMISENGDYAGVIETDLDSFIADAAKAYPAPEPGQRDTRKTQIELALQKLAKRNPPQVRIHRGNVEFLI